MSGPETPAGIIGYKPNPGCWTVRRCVIHELVPPDDDYCPVVMGADEACGLRLSEPLLVREVLDA